MIKTSGKIDHEYVLALHDYWKSCPEYKSGLRFVLLVFLIPVFSIAFFTAIYHSARVTSLVCMAMTLYYTVTLLLNVRKSVMRPKAPAESFRRDCIFGEKAFIFTDHRKHGDFERSRRYESVHSAVEWKDWIIIYINEQEACLIRKKDITEGSPDELRAFLKNKLGARFKTN